MSKWNDSYFSITINASGHKFYGLDLPPDNPTISIVIESELAVSGTRMQLAASSISIDSSAFISGTEIQFAQASLTSSAVTVVISLEEVLASISINATSSVSAQALKLAYSNQVISITSNLAAAAYGILYANIQPSSGNVSTSTTAIEILYASSNISGLSVSVVVGKEILYAKITASAEVVTRTINAIRLSNALVEDTQFIRALLLLDDKPITEHNRKINSSIVQPMAENKNWKSSKSRYYRSASGRQTFSLSWTQVPNSKDNTVDSRFGRDYISQIGSDPDVHTLKVLNIDTNGTTAYSEDEYNVIVKSYSESLVRRDLVGEGYYWDCNLELEEV